MRALKVSIKSEQDIEKLRISGRLAAQVLRDDWRACQTLESRQNT